MPLHAVGSLTTSQTERQCLCAVCNPSARFQAWIGPELNHRLPGKGGERSRVSAEVRACWQQQQRPGLGYEKGWWDRQFVEAMATPAAALLASELARRRSIALVQFYIGQDGHANVAADAAAATAPLSQCIPPAVPDMEVCVRLSIKTELVESEGCLTSDAGPGQQSVCPSSPAAASLTDAEACLATDAGHGRLSARPSSPAPVSLADAEGCLASEVRPGRLSVRPASPAAASLADSEGCLAADAGPGQSGVCPVTSAAASLADAEACLAPDAGHGKQSVCPSSPAAASLANAEGCLAADAGPGRPSACPATSAAATLTDAEACLAAAPELDRLRVLPSSPAAGSEADSTQLGRKAHADGATPHVEQALGLVSAAGQAAAADHSAPASCDSGLKKFRWLRIPRVPIPIVLYPVVPIPVVPFPMVPMMQAMHQV